MQLWKERIKREVSGIGLVYILVIAFVVLVFFFKAILSEFSSSHSVPIVKRPSSGPFYMQ